MSTVDTQKSNPLKSKGEKFSKTKLAPNEVVVKVQKPIATNDPRMRRSYLIYDEGRVRVTQQRLTKPDKQAIGSDLKCYFVACWRNTATQQHSVKLINSPDQKFGQWSLQYKIEDESYEPDW